MEPARSIIARLGGAAVVARITETAYTAPYRWQHPKSKGGTSGLIPQKYHRKLIDYATSNGIDLSLTDFAEVSTSALTNTSSEHRSEDPWQRATAHRAKQNVATKLGRNKAKMV